MRILAIDSSLSSGSVAAADGERIVEVPMAPAKAHARRIAAALAEASLSLGWPVAAAELMAVIHGPGSFTGLRVGVSTAKAIAWACGAALVGVSGFDTIALAAGGTSPLHLAFDAGRGDVVAAVLRPHPAAVAGWVREDAGLMPGSAWIASLPPGARVGGPALLVEGRNESLASRSDLVVLPQEQWSPTAGGVAVLARLLATAGHTVRPEGLQPEYARPSYAEENAPRTSR